MELLKFFLLVTLLITYVVCHPAPDASPANKLKSGVHKNKNRPAAAPKGAGGPAVLNRTRRQFGFGGSSAFANANAFSGGGGYGGSPYGFGSPYGGFGGSNSFASANAGSSSFSG